jgi:hypothetical protein
MKKISLSIVLSLTLLSCTSPEQKSINTYVEENFKDPKSYELISLKCIDTITVTENKIYNLELKTERNLKVNRARMDLVEELFLDFDNNKERFHDLTWENVKAQKEIDKDNKEIEKLEKLPKDKKLYGYLFEHKYRAKNGFNALDLQTDLVNMDLNYKVINVVAKE